MSLTTDDFEEFSVSDPEDDETAPLGDALAELAVDVEVDPVDAVRDDRERLWESRWIRTCGLVEIPVDEHDR